MPDLDLDKIERLAQAATPGPWREGDDPWNGEPLIESEERDERGNRKSVIRAGEPEWGEELGYDVTDEDAAYIAAMSPDVVLALVRRIRELDYAMLNAIRILMLVTDPNASRGPHHDQLAELAAALKAVREGVGS